MFDKFVFMIDDLEVILKTFKLHLVFGIIINIAIICILFKVTDVFVNKLKRHAQNSESGALTWHLIPIVNKIAKFLILFFVVASYLQSNGYSVTSLIAGFGITGLAVGFAAQQTVADFFGTIAIIADKMYKIGDYVKIGNDEGTVEDINLLSTKLRTLDDYLIYVPNNSVSGATIINITKANKRRINELFNLPYDTSNEKIERAMEIITEVCANNKELHKKPLVYLETLAPSSIDIRLMAYAKTKSTAELARIRSDIILEIVKQFRSEQIDFAFPSTSVYIEKK